MSGTALAETRGLNPHAPTKPSGIPWLGNIPKHWGFMKFGRVAYFQEGPGLRNWQFAESGVPVICVTNITSRGIDFEIYRKFISEAEYRQTYRHFTVQQGDLLLSSSGNSWGKVAEYTAPETAILNTSTIRINTSRTGSLQKGYLRWVLQADNVRKQLGAMMTGSCQPNFGPSHLNRAIVPVPPASEQDAIAAFIDDQTAKIDALVSMLSTAIALLRERRTALISAAVTGQIDVRNWKPA
jgi:type I restriction enzyme S subunit